MGECENHAVVKSSSDNSYSCLYPQVFIVHIITNYHENIKTNTILMTFHH